MKDVACSVLYAAPARRILTPCLQLMLAGISTHKDVVYSAFYAAPARRISAPCLHFSPNAPDARVRFAAILARSQILRLMPFFPSFSRSIFAEEPSRTSSLLSALRPAVSPLHLPLGVGLSCRHGEDVAAFRRGDHHDHCLPFYAPSYP
ncbi:hypothetical protein VYS60_004286 [Salmonella enterica]|nr:hypothetical protein [Salmonella enterica]